MDYPVLGSASGVNGRPWYYLFEYMDGTEPAVDQTEIWIYGEPDDMYRRSYYFSKSTARPYYFKAWYRFSLAEETVSPLYYGIARMDVCPDNPWIEGQSVDILNDGSKYEFTFTEFYRENIQPYLSDETYFTKCKFA